MSLRKEGFYGFKNSVPRFDFVSYRCLPYSLDAEKREKSFQNKDSIASAATVAEAKAQRRKRDAANALQFFVARTTRFAAKNQLQIIMPGTVHHGQETCRLTFLLVGHGGVLGVKSLSFGGNISGNVGETGWSRTEEEDHSTFANPHTGCGDDCRILKELLDQNGLSEVPVDCVPVFVNTHARVEAPRAVRFFYEETLFSALESGRLCPASSVCDDACIAKVTEALKGAL